VHWCKTTKTRQQKQDNKNKTTKTLHQHEAGYRCTGQATATAGCKILAVRGIDAVRVSLLPNRVGMRTDTVHYGRAACGVTRFTDPDWRKFLQSITRLQTRFLRIEKIDC